MEQNNNADDGYGYAHPFFNVKEEPPLGHCHTATFNTHIPAAQKNNAIEEEIRNVKSCLTYFKTYLKRSKEDSRTPTHEIALVASQITADETYLKSLKKMRPSRCAVS